MAAIVFNRDKKPSQEASSRGEEQGLPLGLVAKQQPEGEPNLSTPVDMEDSRHGASAARTTPNNPSVPPPPAEENRPEPVSSPQIHSTSSRKPLAVIFLTIFIDLLGFGILIPIIPILLVKPSSPYYLLPHNFTVDQGYIMLGFLTAIFPLMQFFSTPILGQLSDRFGRKPILTLSIAGNCLSYILFEAGVLTQNIPLLFVSRAMSGITGGSVSAAQAAIADITLPKDRAKSFGLIGAAFGLGFILGPYIGGKLSDPSLVSWFNAATPFLFAAVLSFLNVVSVLLFLPETLQIKRSRLTINWLRSVLNVVHAYRIDSLRSLFVSNFLFQAGFAFFTTFSSVYLLKKFHFTQGNIGDFFSYIGIWIALTQAVITRRLSRRFEERQILNFSLILTGVLLFIYLLPNQAWQLLLVAPLFAISIGLSQANLAGLVSRSAEGSVQGEVLGINTSVAALAQSIPPMLAGFIAASISADAPIATSSIIIVLAGLWFIFFYKPNQPVTAEGIA